MTSHRYWSYQAISISDAGAFGRLSSANARILGHLPIRERRKRLTSIDLGNDSVHFSRYESWKRFKILISKDISCVQNELEGALGSPKTKRLYEFLRDAYTGDDRVEMLPSDKCGWRSLVQIAKGTGLSVSSLYGKSWRNTGAELQDLLKHHLVESRYFAGERGRGGRVLRFRIVQQEAHSVRTTQVTTLDEKEFSPRRNEHRLAVLPFVNMSSDPNDLYIADGITEETISTLSNVSGLEVISRTSVMGYRGTSKKVSKIGRELNVESILEGSFRKAGNRARVTVQLVKVGSDGHLWAHSYDGNLDDLLDFQIDIAKEVTEALKIRILANEIQRIDKRPTQNSTAYDLYLRGRFFWNKRTVEDLKRAEECFQQSLKEDPKFALGYAGLADCYMVQGVTFRLDILSNLGRAKVAVNKALELDSELAEAHATKASLLESDFDLREAEEEYRHSIRLKPSYASARHWYARLLIALLRWDEAREQTEKAVDLDPYSQFIKLNHAMYYFLKKDYPNTSAKYQEAVDLDPGNPGARILSVYAYAMMGMHDKAIRELDAWVGLSQHSYPYVRSIADAIIARLESNKQALRELIPEMRKHIGQPFGIAAFDLAGLCFWLGDTEEGFEWLGRAYKAKESGLIYIRLLDDFDAVRADSRYQLLLSKIGLSDS